MEVPEEHRGRCADDGADEQHDRRERLRVARAGEQQVPDRMDDGRGEGEDESLGRQRYFLIAACNTGR